MIENDVVWFAMSAPYSKELEAQILLQSYNIESFIPLCYKIIERKDGCKMRKLVPAIHNLIFFRQNNTTYNSRGQTKDLHSAISHKTGKWEECANHRTRTTNATIYHCLQKSKRRSNLPVSDRDKLDQRNTCKNHWRTV